MTSNLFRILSDRKRNNLKHQVGLSNEEGRDSDSRPEAGSVCQEDEGIGETSSSLTTKA